MARIEGAVAMPRGYLRSQGSRWRTMIVHTLRYCLAPNAPPTLRIFKVALKLFMSTVPACNSSALHSPLRGSFVRHILLHYSSTDRFVETYNLFSPPPKTLQKW